MVPLARGAQCVLAPRGSRESSVGSPQAGIRVAEPEITQRGGPRRIVLPEWDEYDPPVVYYPADLPSPQGGENVVFLGIPQERPADETRGQRWGMDRLRNLARRDDWQSRATAARLLAHDTSGEATALLAGMAGRDPVPVVRYAAGVSLILQGTEESFTQAVALVRETEIPHLTREIWKTARRWVRSGRGRGGCESVLRELEPCRPDDLPL